MKFFIVDLNTANRYQIKAHTFDLNFSFPHLFYFSRIRWNISFFLLLYMFMSYSVWLWCLSIHNNRQNKINVHGTLEYACMLIACFDKFLFYCKIVAFFQYPHGHNAMHENQCYRFRTIKAKNVKKKFLLKNE